METTSTTYRVNLFASWFIRCVLAIIAIGSAIAALAHANSVVDQTGPDAASNAVYNEINRRRLQRSAGTILAVGFVALACDIAEIVTYFRGKLDCKWMLSSNCVKTAIWTLTLLLWLLVIGGVYMVTFVAVALSLLLSISSGLVEVFRVHQLRKQRRTSAAAAAAVKLEEIARDEDDEAGQDYDLEIAQSQDREMAQDHVSETAPPRISFDSKDDSSTRKLVSRPPTIAKEVV